MLTSLKNKQQCSDGDERFCPNKDYSSFLGGNLTMFKFCNYGFMLAKVS
jgi:hypothetical protein